MTSLLNVSSAQIERIAALAEDCVHKPYPYAILHVVTSDDDVLKPRQMYPAFYGCFDWHSSVHGHWLLARVANLYPGTEMAGRAKKLLQKSFSAENLAGELAYLEAHPSFERPYGIAWLLQLGAELRQWQDPEAAVWASRLLPLEQHVAGVFINWLDKASLPVRVGTHSQTAFALGLAHDWAVTANHIDLQQKIEATALRFYGNDTACPVAYEPSAHDFLSPCLAEADLMRRVLPRQEFLSWLDPFLSELDARSGLLIPAVVSDPTDGHLVHLDGLNLSRAWMMHNLLAALPAQHRLQELLEAARDQHMEAGLKSIVDPHYMGGHWLGTFAMYLLTERGLQP